MRVRVRYSHPDFWFVAKSVSKIEGRGLLHCTANGGRSMTFEEELIQRYFDAFNRHDLEAVMACFHSHPTIIDATGTRFEGRDEVQRHYETGFAAMPDCRCDLQMLTGNSGHGVAESIFHGTRPRFNKVIEAIGAEVIEFADGKIKEIRDYHRPLPAKAA